MVNVTPIVITTIINTIPSNVTVSDANDTVTLNTVGGVILIRPLHSLATVLHAKTAPNVVIALKLAPVETPSI